MEDTMTDSRGKKLYGSSVNLATGERSFEYYEHPETKETLVRETDKPAPLSDEEMASIDRKLAVWFERMDRDEPGISIWDRVVRLAILARDDKINVLRAEVEGQASRAMSAEDDLVSERLINEDLRAELEKLMGECFTLSAHACKEGRWDDYGNWICHNTELETATVDLNTAMSMLNEVLGDDFLSSSLADEMDVFLRAQGWYDDD